MGTFWNKERVAQYEDAASFVRYPDVPLKRFFEEIIRPEDTVLEIGSGTGVVSLYLAAMCKRLIAVDEDEYGCEYLKRRIAEKGIHNIDVVNGTWPSEQLEPADVTVTLYVYGFQSKEQVEDLLNATKRAGIIMMPHPGVKGGFPEPLSKRLGVSADPKSGEKEGCRKTVELLEAAGAKVRCETVPHEFGQPVDNLDEAAAFMLKKLKLDESYLPKIREVAGDYVELREGKHYVPLEHSNCVITFEK